MHSWAELSCLTEVTLWPDGWRHSYGVMSLPVFVMYGGAIDACYSEAGHVIYGENISKDESGCTSFLGVGPIFFSRPISGAFGCCWNEKD